MCFLSDQRMANEHKKYKYKVFGYWRKSRRTTGMLTAGGIAHSRKCLAKPWPVLISFWNIQPPYSIGWHGDGDAPRRVHPPDESRWLFPLSLSHSLTLIFSTIKFNEKSQGIDKLQAAWHWRPNVDFSSPKLIINFKTIFPPVRYRHRMMNLKNIIHLTDLPTYLAPHTDHPNMKTFMTDSVKHAHNNQNLLTLYVLVNLLCSKLIRTQPFCHYTRCTQWLSHYNNSFCRSQHSQHT